MGKTADCGDCINRKCQLLPELHKPGAVNFEKDRKFAPIASCSAGAGEQRPSLQKQPCPPLTSKPKEQGKALNFRRRKIEGECPHWSLQSKENFRFNAARASQICLQTDQTPKVGDSRNRCTGSVSVNDFTMLCVSPGSENLVTTVRVEEEEEEEEENYEYNQVRENCRGQEREKRDRGSANLSEEGSSSGMIRLTNRKQAKSNMELPSLTPHHVSTETHFLNVSKEKQRPYLSSLDIFARRLGSNETSVCCGDLELTDGLECNACKNLHVTKKLMINNWLMDVAIKR